VSIGDFVQFDHAQNRKGDLQENKRQIPSEEYREREQGIDKRNFARGKKKKEGGST
jgi:hypothetical protein